MLSRCGASQEQTRVVLTMTRYGCFDRATHRGISEVWHELKGVHQHSWLLTRWKTCVWRWEGSPSAKIQV